MAVQIFIPARNEQANLGRLLESLVAQQGIDFRITVIDDHSTDRTRAIAESFSGVRVITPPQPPPGVSGKVNALMFAVEDAEANPPADGFPEWFLFTDADTWHYPGSLAASVAEARERKVDLLSYSPEQEASTWSEIALMPLVFADLTHLYPSDRINDPADPVAAANGQYILVRRAVYHEMGRHSHVAGELMEDLAMAIQYKAAGRRIWFRHGAGLVRTRMYRDFHSLYEGWTKGLATIFPNPLPLAAWRALQFLMIAALFLWTIAAAATQGWHAALLPLALWAVSYAYFLVRVRRAHFPWKANLAAFAGLPLFVWLLVRSYLHLRVRGAVSWKGRTYQHSEPGAPLDSSKAKDISG